MMEPQVGWCAFLALAFLVKAAAGMAKAVDQRQWDKSQQPNHAGYVMMSVRDNEVFPLEADVPALSPDDLDLEEEAPYSLQLFENFASAAQLALDQCQRQFRWSRWNCPEHAFNSMGQPRYESTRESAFVAAIKAAALVHSITRSCSRGELRGCGCHANPSVAQPASADDKGGRWIWGGCSDDVARGQHVAEEMTLTPSEKGADAHVYAHLHNSRVGREVVRAGMQKHCKCHGVSGSCTVRTCWVELGAFADVGVALKRRYKRAIRADLATKKGQLYSGNRDRSSESEAVLNFERRSKSELVYIADSADYCLANFTSGWTGTEGRVCDKTRGAAQSPEQRRSCRTLCRACGRRVLQRRRVVVWHCNCAFKWCCDVKCETCRKTVTEHYCS